MVLNLKELEKKLDETLDNETPESLREWLDKKEEEERVADLEHKQIKADITNKIAEELKGLITEAYNDMTIIYAPDCFYKSDRDNLSEKIKECGKGGIGYIDTKYQEAIKKLDELVSSFPSQPSTPKDQQ